MIFKCSQWSACCAKELRIHCQGCSALTFSQCQKQLKAIIWTTFLLCFFKAFNTGSTCVFAIWECALRRQKWHFLMTSQNMTLFISYKLTNLRPSQDILKECVNGEHWDLAIKQQNKIASIILCQLCFAKFILLTAQTICTNIVKNYHAWQILYFASLCIELWPFTCHTRVLFSI